MSKLQARQLARNLRAAAVVTEPGLIRLGYEAGTGYVVDLVVRGKVLTRWALAEDDEEDES